MERKDESAEPKKPILYTDSEWFNGGSDLGFWAIEWEDADTVKITGPYNQEARIHGGDFEGVLSGLCAAYSLGRQE